MLAPLAYFPPISYFEAIKDASHVVLDQHEHFIKQTPRSRCEVYGANGRLKLVVPVKRRNHTPMKDVLIDNNGKWAENHIKTIRSAYAKAPYFEDYFPEIESILSAHQSHLVTLNKQTIEFALKALTWDTQVLMSYTFETYQNNDFRLNFGADTYSTRSYFQVFEEKHGFLPNLSILDLLMNAGLESGYYISG